MNPLISVIVPVYNTEKYLRRCLDSICGQTYSNLEILCVNDGSTDGSASILEEYATKDTRLKVFTQQNAGQAAARNLALKHATGDWVTGVDSDDFLDFDTFEAACSCISEAVDIISFGVQILWDGIEADTYADQFYAPRGIMGIQVITAELLQNTPWEFCSKLWRRSFLEHVHAYFPQGLHFEDWFFFFAYTPAASGIYFMDTQKYHYVRRQNSTMSQAYSFSTRNMDHLKVLELLLKIRHEQTLSFDITPVNLFNFIQTYQFVSHFAPDNLLKTIHVESLRLAEQYGLLNRYPDYLRFLKPHNWWQKLTATHRLGKTRYGFGPIKPLSIKYRNRKKKTYFMGIKLYESAY